ncbi:hypothetical protein LTR84_010021 [Exophiala bonariae]|uniref:Uncharacterized protein n=1 Tax=Exophiala bonariae TaxID=1690606 RepID=A0AAV9NK05_9EURO|nr:hypothetical protein LTR84_010021 [Exophiala bonariae]
MPGRRATSSERRNPCTHMLITRLFDQYGSLRCSLCHKHANIGWFYRCTQDSNGTLPEANFIGISRSHTKKSPSQDVALHTLSIPIIKAIGEGQYTDEQIKTLIQQKENVRAIILAQEPRPATASTVTTTTSSSSTSSKFDSLFLPKSTTFSTTSTASLDEEIRKAYDWGELQKVWMSESAVPSLESSSPIFTQSRPPSHSVSSPPKDCSFMICPTCRPAYRERAFQSLDEFLNTPVKIPPIWELTNRPISDARVLARLQVPTTQDRFYSRAGQNAVQSVCSFFTTNEHIPTATEESTPGDKHSVRKRGGFRQTVRRVLARARSEESSTVQGLNSNEETIACNLEDSGCPRPYIFRRPRSRPTLSFVETHGQLVDTSGLQDSVMLVLATNTPLPHTPSHANTFFDSARTEHHSQHIQDGMNLHFSDIIAHS